MKIFLQIITSNNLHLQYYCTAQYTISYSISYSFGCYPDLIYLESGVGCFQITIFGMFIFTFIKLTICLLSDVEG